MYRCTRALTHRPERAGSAVPYAHVPAFLAIEIACYVWADALRDACGDLLNELNVRIVALDSSFGRELFVGDADFTVVLVRTGRTSLALEVAIAQGGEHAATLGFTFAHVGGNRAQPLSDEQRRLLGALESGE